MKALVTGSSGHLGEALMRVLRAEPDSVAIGLDLKASPFTTHLGSITDPTCVARCMAGVDVVYHTATLHKPHLVTHSNQNFIDTNISGTLTLLEAAVANGVGCFVFTSTTSVFGDAMRPPPGEPAAWITEDTKPIPKNIYGTTKAAAEDLCQLFHRKHRLNCIILRTSRFFPEEDDNRDRRKNFTGDNIKVNEYLYRRVEISDVVSAHRSAAEKAAALGYGRYIVSATTPFRPEDIQVLNSNAEDVVHRRVPGYRKLYEALGWRMFDRIDRVYLNTAARADLDWTPAYDFKNVLRRCAAGDHMLSPLAVAIGIKGYHDSEFEEGPYPVEQ